MKKIEYIRILSAIAILILFYYFGLSLYSIIILGIILFLSILLRGKLYTKLDEFISKKFPFLSKHPHWFKKMIIIFVFILIYIAIKQALFLLLKIFGFDLQRIISDGISESIK